MLCALTLLFTCVCFHISRASFYTVRMDVTQTGMENGNGIFLKLIFDNADKFFLGPFFFLTFFSFSLRCIFNSPLYTQHFLHSTLHIPKIGHFRISLNLFLKASLCNHPFIWKWDFIHMQIKLIFIWMVVHQASLWWRGLGELGKAVDYMTPHL